MKYENFTSYLLDNNAADEKIALIVGGEKVQYGQLRDNIQKISEYFAKTGLIKGDRVLLLEEPSLFWVCSYLGTMLAGGVAVPIYPKIKSEKLENIVVSCSPVSVFTNKKLLEKYGSVLKGIKAILNDSVQEKGNLRGIANSELLVDSRSLPVGYPGDLAAIMYTSGSSGEPRGVMVTHGNLIANTESIIEYMSLTGNDRIMAVLPFYYCFGASLLHTHLRIGGSVVVETSFLFPEKVLDRMESTGCTGFAGVPSTYQILLRNSTFKDREFPNLRYFQQAGGKLPVNFIEELIRSFPGKELFIMYGQTEATARLSYLPPEYLDRKLGSIGRGIPGVRLEVLNSEGMPVEPDQVGEIVASGENITAGYWNAPEETAKSFRNGKLYTGDLATVDQEGFIYVVDREKEFIKCAGHRVSSKELEAILVKLDGVIEAAAVPIPDDTLGEAVCVFVSHVKGDNAAGEVMRHCKKNIQWPFTPKKIICVKHLPKNSSGKVDKVRMKEMLKGGE